MKRTRLQFGRWSLVVVSLMVLLFPIYWMVASSLSPSARLMTPNPGLVPAEVTFENYTRVWTASPFPRFLLNSAKVSCVVTLLAVPLAFGGGYALARYRFRGRLTFGLTLLITQMLPPLLLAIPLYVTLARLGWVDTHRGLIVCCTTFAVPFATWMLRGFFEGLPGEVEDSALVDGCSRWGLMWRIVLPLAAPGLTVAAMLAFLLSWNEYLFALLLINSQDKKTFPIGLDLFVSQWQVDYGALMAASVMVSAPVAGLFLALQHRLVSGLTAGAVKG